MTITYNWKILEMTTNPSIDGLMNVVTSTTWSAEVENTDNSNSEMVNIITCATGGKVSFNKPNSNDFIEYTNLTEQEVLNWIWNNGVNKELIEKELLNKITPNQQQILTNPW